MFTPAPPIVPHLERLGLVWPTGLVVSSSALARNGATLRTRDVAGQWRLQACVEDRPVDDDATAPPVVSAFRAFVANMLDWSFSPKSYARTPELPIPPESEVRLLPSAEVRCRKFAARGEPAAASKPTDGNRTEASPWQTLVDVSPHDDGFDPVVHQDRHRCPRAHGASAAWYRRTRRLGCSVHRSAVLPPSKQRNLASRA